MQAAIARGIGVRLIAGIDQRPTVHGIDTGYDLEKIRALSQLVGSSPSLVVLLDTDLAGPGKDLTGHHKGQQPIDHLLERNLSTEQKILEKVSGNLGVLDEKFCENLANWSDIIRRTFNDGGIDEVISTRRLVHIIRAFAIWNDRLKAIKVCVNRFDDETKQSFIELYDKIDADVVTEESNDQ